MESTKTIQLKIIDVDNDLVETMQKYSVKWILNGEMLIEAADAQTAERLAQEQLVATVMNPDAWPQELGAQGIQGAASEITLEAAE